MAGELALRGPTLFSGYWPAEETNAAAFPRSTSGKIQRHALEAEFNEDIEIDAQPSIFPPNNSEPDMPPQIRLAVDVGGTFTDVVLEQGDQQTTLKVLTTPAAPEEGVLTGIDAVLAAAGVAAAAVDMLIHGTTLATNALIERKGAKTALITTAGLRDSVEMALENRFEQYDLNIDRPTPIVPRHLRFAVEERLNHLGEVLVPLDAASVRALVQPLARSWHRGGRGRSSARLRQWRP